MILSPYSIVDPQGNTVLLQSTDYVTSIPRASALSQMPVNVAYIKRAGAVPVFAGKDFQPVTLNLEILAQHDFMTLLEEINRIFDTKYETPQVFTVIDTEDSNKAYYTYVTTKQVQGGNDGNMFVVTLAFDDPIWQSTTQNSQTFSITSATDSTSVTAAGNDESYPIFEITPTTQPSTDYLYNMYVQILPTSTDPFPKRFLDLTGSTDTTFDTAALVSGGKMQSAGQDLRVFRDGVEIDCWLDGMNTTDTHVIVVADMPGSLNMTLKTAIASTDTISEVVLNNTPDNRTKITSAPPSGRLILDSSLGSTDSEEFTYTAKTITSTKLAFTINARSVRNTSASSFAANANVRFLPYDFNIIYGNSTVTARTTDDTLKPIQALTSRNNTFTYTNFLDEDGLRAGIWKKERRIVSSPALSRSGFYTSTNDEGDTDPATALGLSAYTFESLGTWRGDSVQIGWLLYIPDGVASVVASGAQIQSIVSRPTYSLQRAAVPTTFTNLWTISAQSATDYGTWTTWSKASTDAVLPTGQKYLRFFETGTITSTTDVMAKAEIQSITVGITNYPHVMLRSESLNYRLNCTISNDTTGESFAIDYPMALNETLIIDSDPNFPNAKHKGQIVNGAVLLSTTRPCWLRLQPGANTIGFESNLAAASDITIVIKWRDRANFL